MKNDPSLVIRDTDDLEVMSAAFQDALMRVGDITFLPKKRRFAGVVNRFKWEDAAPGPDGEASRAQSAGKRIYTRVRTGFHFDGVYAVKTQNIARDRREGILELLAIRFSGRQDGGGEVKLIFSGGGTIVLQVECLEAGFHDLGPSWSTLNRPRHGDTDDEDA